MHTGAAELDQQWTVNHAHVQPPATDAGPGPMGDSHSYKLQLPWPEEVAIRIQGLLKLRDPKCQYFSARHSSALQGAPDPDMLVVHLKAHDLCTVQAGVPLPVSFFAHVHHHQ